MLVNSVDGDIKLTKFEVTCSLWRWMSSLYIPNWDKFKAWPSWKFLNFPFTAFSVSNSIRHLGCFAHREQRIFLTELLSTPPMLPCSHPATRPECRLPSWSAPPKLLAVPLKHEAMNGKECTPEFDSIYSSYVLKLPGVCYFFGLSGLQIPWCGPFWDFTLSSAEMDTTVKRAVCGVEAGTTWFIFGLGNGRLSLSRKSPMLVLASKK